MAGRTHLQQALPDHLRPEMRGLGAAADHPHRSGWTQLRPRVEQVEFAGAAGTLASLGDQGIAVMEGLAAELGLAAPAAPWHVSRDGLAETVAFLGLVCGSLAKLATDVILLAQTEVAEVAEPYVAGRGALLHHAAEAQPDRLRIHPGRGAHRAGAGAGDAGRDGGGPRARHRAVAGGAAGAAAGFVLTHGALQHARAIAEGMVVDAERMRAQPRPHRRADRGRGGDDGPRAAARPRRGASRGASMPATLP